MLRTRSPRRHALAGRAPSPQGRLCPEPCAPLGLACQCPGRPAPAPLAVLSPHPPQARFHALPVLRPLGSRGTFLAGVGSAGACAAPQAWEPLPPLTAAERTPDGAGNTAPHPAQPSMARWRCFCSLLTTEEGTATHCPLLS